MPSWLIWKGSHDERPRPRRHDQAGAFFFGGIDREVVRQRERQRLATCTRRAVSVISKKLFMPQRGTQKTLRNAAVSSLMWQQLL